MLTDICESSVCFCANIANELMESDQTWTVDR